MTLDALATTARTLNRATLPRDYERSLDELLDALVQLDAGMISGCVVSPDVKRATYAAATELTKAAFNQFAALDPARARRWINGLAIYRRPRELDLDAMQRSIPVNSVARALDVETLDVSDFLREQLRSLLQLAASDPQRHRLNGPATHEEIDERERELGVRMPRDLRTLYSVCDGFALFREEGAADGESPFRLVSLAELRTRAYAHERLLAFDLGNGNYLSCVTLPDASVWLDDMREGQTRVVARSLAEVLGGAFAAAHLDPESGLWNSEWARVTSRDYASC